MVELRPLVRVPRAEVDERVAEVRERPPAEEAKVEARLRAEAGSEDGALVGGLRLGAGAHDDVEEAPSDGVAVPRLRLHLTLLLGAAVHGCRGLSVLPATAARQVGRGVDKWGRVV